MLGKLVVLVAVAAAALGFLLREEGPKVSIADVVGGRSVMKAAQYASYGPPSEVLHVVPDRPVPAYGPNDVVIAVVASAGNPVDYKFMEGYKALLDWPMGLLPDVTGFDVAGTVVAVGANVPASRLQPGDDVYGMAHFLHRGTVAEFAVLAEHLVAKKPRGLSFADAAGVPLVGLTSLQALRDQAGMQEGAKVLVLGASSGTGTLAVQLARALGASHVAGTASARNTALVRRLGADRVVDYRTQNFWEALAGEDFDVVYDCVGSYAYWEGSHAVLKPGSGRFVTIAGDKQAPFTVPNLLLSGWRIASRKALAALGQGPGYSFFTTIANRADLDVLTALIDAGKLAPVTDRAYSLDDAAEAFDYLASGKASGKVVVCVDEVLCHAARS